MRFRVMLCLLLLLSSCAAAEEMTLTVPDVVRAGQRSAVVLTLPADGELTVTVTDGRGAQKPLAEAMAVPRGSVTLPFSGVSYGNMPLKQGTCRFTATLTDDNGAVTEVTQTAKVYAPTYLLEYALPRALRVYREPRFRWSADIGVTSAAVVRLEIFSDEAMTELVTRVRKQVSNAGMIQLPWDGTSKRGDVPAGLYYARIFAEGQEKRCVTFALEILAGTEPTADLAPTGSMLPATLSDADVWAALMQPLVVADITDTEHQKISETADGRGRAGVLHGQTHGVEVLEVGARTTRIRTARQEDGATVEGYLPTELLKTVVPDSRYGVLIDTGSQTLTVYENGGKLGSMRVSTGKDEFSSGNHYRGTLTGAFLTEDHMPSFESSGCRYEYPIRIDGGNLLHQLGYNAKSGFGDETALLGTPASSGCVRMDYRTDETHTINAYWLWTHLRRCTKVLVMDSQATVLTDAE